MTSTRFATAADFEAGFGWVGAELLGVQSDWNGALIAGEPGPESAAAGAWTDGGVYAHPDVVLGPIRQAYAHAGDPDYFTRGRLVEVAFGLEITLHESLHLARQSSMSRQEAFARAHGRPGVRTLEEGTTELAAQALLGRYIDALGFEQIAPGIRGACLIRPYPAQTAAVQALVETVAEATSLDADELILDLARVNCAEKFAVLAEQLTAQPAYAHLTAAEAEQRLTTSLAPVDGLMKDPSKGPDLRHRGRSRSAVRREGGT